MIEFYKFRLHILGLSFNDIGRLFDRDQSSVQYCVKKVEAALKLKNAPLESILQDITSNIQNTPY